MFRLFRRKRKKATHDLKLNVKYWNDVMSGDKGAELRKHDRDYRRGDTVRFWQVKDNTCRRQTSSDLFVITHVLEHWQFKKGIRKGYCLFSIKKA